MSGKEIYIVTGDVHSGKTTRLLEWLDGRNDVYGFVTPVINNRRIFMDVFSKEHFEMEAGEDDSDPLLVGKYRFDKASFERASKIVSDALDKFGWLIIDEVGPLELQGKGFYKVLVEVLDSENKHLKIIVVIREKLLEEVKSFFEFKRFDVQNFNLENTGI